MTDTAHELFTRLFKESRDALRRYVRRWVRSEATAEEIVQEAFLRTYEYGDSIRTPRAFLFSTAHHLAIDHRRRDHTATTDAAGYLQDSGFEGSGASLDEFVIADEASRMLKQAIDRLPPQCHAALTLKVFHGYSYKEIGETLGISGKTVEKHIALGLARTHEYLRTRYPESGGDKDREGDLRG